VTPPAAESNPHQRSWPRFGFSSSAPDSGHSTDWPPSAASHTKNSCEKAHTVWVAQFQIRVLSLEKVIASKELANRDKDRAMLPLMRTVLDAQQQRNTH